MLIHKWWINIHFICVISFTEAWRVDVPIKKDGSIANLTLMPNCDDNSRIYLESYTYLNKTCNEGSICLRQSAELSLEVETLLHASCSLRNSCRDMQFPVSDIQTKGFNLVSIVYQCLPHTSLLDLCNNTTKSTNDTLHLISGDNATTFKKCQCRIDGKFTLTLNDVRLKAKHTTHCSSAVLQVEFDKLVCDDKVKAYGSVFKKPVERSMSSANVLFAANSRNETPEMVWITVRPEHAATTVSCDSVPRKPEVMVTLAISTTTKFNATVPELYSKHTGENLADGHTSSSSTVALISILVVMVTLVAVVVCFVMIMYRRKKRKGLPEQTELKKIPSEAEQPIMTKEAGEADLKTEVEAENGASFRSQNSHPSGKHIYEKTQNIQAQSADDEEPYDKIRIDKVTVTNPTYDRLREQPDMNTATNRTLFDRIYSWAKEPNVK